MAFLFSGLFLQLSKLVREISVPSAYFAVNLNLLQKIVCSVEKVVRLKNI